MGLFNKKTKEEKADKVMLQMVNMFGENFLSWNGNLYESDIVRACIRPKALAVSKMIAIHKLQDEKTIKINPRANYRFMLQYPNSYMTISQFLTKVANQYELNNNAFILKVRNDDGIVTQMYPVICHMVETIWNDGYLYLKFFLLNGKTLTVPYSDIIHIKGDYYEDDIFGTSPAKALTGLMNLVGTIDQGLSKAIKNSAAIKYLLKFTQAMRPEDIKKNVEEFVKNYMDSETDTFGAAGVDSKADVQRIESKEYVPNAVVSANVTDRLYAFFNTNKKIVCSDWTEDEYNAYYEAVVVPFVNQLSQVFTKALFSRKEIAQGNSIEFSSSTMAAVSMKTKLNLVQMVDRGALTPNEWRASMNLEPIDGGDQPIRRLDTQVVNLVEQMLNQVNNTNYVEMMACIRQLLVSSERSKDEAHNQH